MNARVLPMGPPRDGRPGWEHVAEALLWAEGRVVLVGSSREVRSEAARRGIAVQDLDGRVVLPGFVDAHTHFLHVGVKKTRPDLRGARSLGEALQRLSGFLAEHPGSHHVIGEGWDESEWTPAGAGERAPDGRARRPTKADVDAVVAAAAKAGHGPPDRPVVLRRICGHIAVAGSGALPRIRARWDDDEAVDLGSGLLLEAPSLYLNEVLASTPQEFDRAVQEACAEAHRLGVTAVGDYSQAPYRAALQRAAARGTLTVRVASSIYTQQLDAEVGNGFRTGRPALAPTDLRDDVREALTPRQGPSSAAVAARGQRTSGAAHIGATPGRDGGDVLRGGHSAWLRDGGLKVFLDGSLGGHTAHVREPYLDLDRKDGSDDHAGHDHGPQGTGQGVDPRFGSRIWSDAELDRWFGVAHRNGVQVHAHAIGDAAIDQGLDAFARLRAREDLEGRGWAVEAMPREPSQPGEADPGGAPHRLGPALPGAGSLRHRFEHFEIVHDEHVGRAVELGIVSSSQPNFVGEWSAKGGMYESRLGARYRLNNRFRSFVDAGLALAFGSDGMPFGPLVGLQSAVQHPEPDQRLTPAEAVWHYTTGAAWSLHWEDAIGHLGTGRSADLVILDQKGLDETPAGWRIVQVYTGGMARL